MKELSAVSAFALLWFLSIGTAYAADPAATIAALDARLAKIGAAKLEEPRQPALQPGSVATAATSATSPAETEARSNFAAAAAIRVSA